MRLNCQESFHLPFKDGSRFIREMRAGSVYTIHSQNPLAIPKEECDCYILALKTTYLITDVEFLWLNSHSLVWRSCRKICSEEDELFFFSKILFVLPLHAMLSNSLWYAADFMSHRLIRFNFGNWICISKRQERKGKTTVLETKLLIASFAWY